MAKFGRRVISHRPVFLQHVSSLVLPSTMLNMLLSLPTDVIHLPRASSSASPTASEFCNGEEDCGRDCVAVAPPLVGSEEPAVVTARLVSSVLREGQVGLGRSELICLVSVCADVQLDCSSVFCCFWKRRDFVLAEMNWHILTVMSAGWFCVVNGA